MAFSKFALTEKPKYKELIARHEAAKILDIPAPTFQNHIEIYPENYPRPCGWDREPVSFGMTGIWLWPKWALERFSWTGQVNYKKDRRNRDYSRIPSTFIEQLRQSINPESALGVAFVLCLEYLVHPKALRTIEINEDCLQIGSPCNRVIKPGDVIIERFKHISVDELCPRHLSAEFNSIRDELSLPWWIALRDLRFEGLCRLFETDILPTSAIAAMVNKSEMALKQFEYLRAFSGRDRLREIILSD